MEIIFTEANIFKTSLGGSGYLADFFKFELVLTELYSNLIQW